jgi:hypothetical protein
MVTPPDHQILPRHLEDIAQGDAKPLSLVCLYPVVEYA